MKGLRETGLVFVLLWGIVVPQAKAQAYTPVSVTGFNFDAVCEGFPNATLFTTGTMDLTNHIMYSQGFAASAGISGGLPNSGTIVSAGNTYQLAPYNSLNALYINSGSGTLNLPAPNKYNSISIAGFCTEGTGSIQVALNFTDGTTATFPTTTLSDWFFAAGPIISGFGRIARVTSAPYSMDGFPADPRIYALNFNLACTDKQKNLSSITITKISGSNVFILAVSGNLPPTVTANGGNTCAGAPFNLTSSVTPPGGTYSWSPGGATTASTSVSPVVNTTYTLTYTVGGCAYTDTANVSILPAPVVNVPSATICPSSSAVLTASGADTYTWSPATGLSATTGTSVTASPGSTTTYTITGTGSNGCTGTTTSTVTISSVIPIAVNSAAICNGTDTVLTASGADTYTWSPATGLSATTGANVTANPSVTTTYIVTGTDSAGCSGTDTATVTVLPIPDVTATPPAGSTCDGETTAIALGSSIPGTSFSWTVVTSNVNGATNGSGTSIAQVLNCNTPPTGTATYTVTPTASGCAGTPINVVITVGSVTLDSMDTTPIACAGGTSTLTVYASAATQYSVDGGATFQASNVFTLHAGTYTVIASKAGGCQDDTTITITEPASMTLAMSPDVSVCIGLSTTIFAAASGGTAPYTYTWDNGLPAGPSHTISPAATTTYNVSVTDASGCGPVTGDVLVTLNPPITVNALSDQSICENTSTAIGVNVSGGNGGPYSYTWTNNSNSAVLVGADQVVSPLVTTTYYVTVTDGCDTTSYVDSILITILPAPSVTYAIDKDRGCAPLVVTFERQPQAGSTCTWDFGDGSTGTGDSIQHVFPNAGCYDIHLTATSSDGCLADTLVNNQICVYPVPLAQFSFGPQPTDVYQSQISFYNLTTGGNTYSWDFDGEGYSNLMHPVIDFPADSAGSYRVCLTAISTQGCIDTACHTVVIDEAFSVYVPNAFTPNGDGINETFGPVVRGEDITAYDFMVFDRWGEIIFRSGDPLKGWDGMRNGLWTKEDVYVWKLKVRDLRGIDHEFKGHFNLLR